MIKVIAFDFDGVLADSNKLKEDVYFEILPKSDHALVKTILADQNIVRTRTAVFRAIFASKGFSGENLEIQSAVFSARYNDFVQEGIEKMGLMPGAEDALRKLSAEYPLYINSHTPHDALLETVIRLGIGYFFKGVFGRKNLNSKKSEVLKEIIKDEEASPEEVLMVGDANSDFEAAREAGCRFVGVANDYNGWQKKEFPLVRNISGISQFL